jgi:hypothetical protein
MPANLQTASHLVMEKSKENARTSASCMSWQLVGMVV